MIYEDLTLVTTKDGEQIAVWEIIDDSISVKANTAITKQNIFLTHGTFSDKKVCLGIASYLAGLGHTCYIMEWRGHGSSSLPEKRFNFETVATHDYEATFRYLFDDLKLDNLHCVTHSGGGVGLAMFLVQNNKYIDKVNSISTFACQAYAAVSSPISYAKIFAAKLFTKILGYIPAKKLGLGPFNESYYTMNQWYNWNLQKNFQSSFIRNRDLGKNNKRKPARDIEGKTEKGTAGKKPLYSGRNERIDYRQHMAAITIPVYAISGKGDLFISPTQGCQLFFDNFGNTENVFREYAKSNGNLEDYDHTRVLMSRNSSTEIWPTVAAWIAKYAS